MESTFWHQKWKTNDIGYHQPEANSLLVKHFNKLSLPQNSRVFVPLCGKTIDISWLLSKGYRVTGVEVNEMAVEQLFESLSTKPEISTVGELNHYSTENIDIFAGDIFGMSAAMLGPVDAVYDRTAFVALPAEMRRRYATHVITIANEAPQLLICYEYEQDLMEGPPFSISNNEMHRCYSVIYELSKIESVTVPGGLKGIQAVKENVWLLNDKI